MTDREKIRDRIQKYYNIYKDCCDTSPRILHELLNFLNSLPEEPVSEGLDEACQLAWQDKEYCGDLKQLFLDAFKAGDYVISTKNPAIKYRINGTGINEHCERDYICEDVSGGEFYGKFRKITASKLDEWARLWTIQDAKDGDVLINWNNTIFIFKAIEDETVKFHIAYNEKWNAIKTPSTKLSHLGLPEPQFEFHPATKEQRDLLESKMREAGYSWNPKTKTLEKIQKTDLDNTNGTNTIRFDKEEELTEFEKEVAHVLIHSCYDGTLETEEDVENAYKQYAKQAKFYAPMLLEKAREQIVSEVIVKA